MIDVAWYQSLKFINQHLSITYKNKYDWKFTDLTHNEI